MKTAAIIILSLLLSSCGGNGGGDSPINDAKATPTIAPIPVPSQTGPAVPWPDYWPGAGKYLECSNIGVPAAGIGGVDNTLIFMNTVNVALGPSQLGPPADQWIEYDVTQRVPADVKAVFLAGILLITNNATSPANMTVAFAAPNAGVDPHSYTFQATLAGYGGVRQPASTWVPVVNGKFWLFWHASYIDPNTYYGFNLSINAYCR